MPRVPTSPTRWPASDRAASCWPHHSPGTGHRLRDAAQAGQAARHDGAAHYALEYGTDQIEIQHDAIKKGTRVALVDDLLAPGGNTAAAGTLLGSVGGVVPTGACSIELTFLDGRKRLKVPVETLLKYDS